MRAFSSKSYKLDLIKPVKNVLKECDKNSRSAASLDSNGSRKGRRSLKKCATGFEREEEEGQEGAALDRF